MSDGLLLALTVGSVSWAVTVSIFCVHLWRTHVRIHDYARREADHYGISERGFAYNDMAIVITLDGKAEPKHELEKRLRHTDS